MADKEREQYLKTIAELSATVAKLSEELAESKADILRFASDWSVPFTNNEAERCVRFSKVKVKVSGCFRTKAGADNFMRIMSYIGSAKKHGMTAFAALLEAVNGRSLQTVQAWA